MFIIRLAINALVLLGAAYIIPGIHVASLYTAIIVAIVLGIINTIVRPVLFVLTLPINILTLGLFSFVLNGLLFWFVASFVKGFTVDTFLAALLGSLFVAICNSIASKLIKNA
jgi:putative membrane protein